MKRIEVKRLMNEGVDNSNFDHGRCAVVLSEYEDFDYGFRRLVTVY